MCTMKENEDTLCRPTASNVVVTGITIHMHANQGIHRKMQRYEDLG